MPEDPVLVERVPSEETVLLEAPQESALAPDLGEETGAVDLWSAGQLPELDELDQEPPPKIRRERSGPWGRLAERWVPEPLRDSRVDPSRRGALILTLVAAIAAVVAAIGVWREKPTPRPVESMSLLQVSDTTVLSTGRTRPIEPAGQLVVSVTGAVSRPGLVRLAAGSRVADAIAAAGGVTAAAELAGLNLAEKLADGRSVVVPTKGAGPVISPAGAAPPTAGSSGSPVNLNMADQAALDALPGIGQVTAGKILAWRAEHGSFSSVEQLQEIEGIGPAKFALIAPLVTV